MKKFNLIPAVIILLLAACNSSSTDAGAGAAGKSFCKDTSCMTEPISVTSEAAGKPFVKVSYKDCKIDSIHYEKGGAGVIKSIIFSEFITNDIKPSKEAFKIDIIDGKYAWVRFNDCATSRGYALKLAFDKTGNTQKITTAINNFDPKYHIADSLVAYYDNTFIYVQDMNTDKVAKQLLTDVGVRNHDVNDIHSLIDTVNITRTSIYAKILFEGKTIEHNKPLEFK